MRSKRTSQSMKGSSVCSIYARLSCQERRLPTRALLILLKLAETVLDHDSHRQALSPAVAAEEGLHPGPRRVYEQFKLPDEFLAATFANAVMVAHMAEEFRMDFIVNSYPRSIIVCRVLMVAVCRLCWRRDAVPLTPARKNNQCRVATKRLLSLRTYPNTLRGPCIASDPIRSSDRFLVSA